MDDLRYITNPWLWVTLGVYIVAFGAVTWLILRRPSR